MSFSFNETAGASQSTVKPKLEGNKIHEVVLASCKTEDIVGVKDTSITYKVIKIEFENEEGIYQHTVFEPKGDDFVNLETEYTKDGRTNKIKQPSGVQSMMLLFKHMIDGFAPEIAEQIDSGKKSLVAKDWDDLRILVVKILGAAAAAKRENKIKLVKNKKGEGIFPGYFASLNKEGKPYIKNNFVGQKVAFSAYEAQRMQNEANASPTNMNNSGFNLPNNSSADLDLTFTIDEL